MPEADGQQHTQHKESLVERIFEHHHNHEQEENSHNEKKNEVSKNTDKPKSYEDYLKKDDEALKKYYKEDREL
ncbi:hypothetical protein N7471_000998 [Penicillium samsonianum]|uniref:uncharacterized protein n=1 Tax=Penicillium samsonianum TaxID=1882272 RepID=UPI002548AEDB|nr:uncharacterized protein N7471_000998 [Penicillium samsonianum]KAJ6149799.1 hypothetical protein N7471_000998 [Penicillium samsonianum]